MYEQSGIANPEGVPVVTCTRDAREVHWFCAAATLSTARKEKRRPIISIRILEFSHHVWSERVRL